MKEKNVADYIDNLGNQDIFDMSLKAAVCECNERIEALERACLTIIPGSDPSPDQMKYLIEWLYNAPYVVHQFLYSSVTPVRQEHGSIILIELDTLEKHILPILFNRDQHFPSFAHEYLKKLRRFCTINEIQTPSEMQYILEVNFYGSNS